MIKEKSRKKRRGRIRKARLDLFSLFGGVLAVIFAVFLTAAFSDPGNQEQNQSADFDSTQSGQGLEISPISELANDMAGRFNAGQTLLDFPGMDGANLNQDLGNLKNFTAAAFNPDEIEITRDFTQDFILYASPAEFDPDFETIAFDMNPENGENDNQDNNQDINPAFAARDSLPRFAENAPDLENNNNNNKFDPASLNAGEFTPSEFSETFLFNGDSIPIYENQDLTPRRVELSDFVWKNGRPEYIGDDFDVKFGVDVSEHQNSDRYYLNYDIDWKAAKADGVDFAMIRVGFRGTTSGEINEDTCYDRNITAAMEAGIQTGVYFFSQAITIQEALEEADFVLDCLRGYPIDGPVGYDWEVASRSYRNHGLDDETATACALAFCQRIESGGYTPMIYATRETFYYDFDMGVLSPYMIWYPQYPRGGDSSRYPNFYYQMDVWQFSDRCPVDGIGKRVDVNLWFVPKA